MNAENGIIPAPGSNFTIVHTSRMMEKLERTHETRPRFFWEKDPSEIYTLIKPAQLRWKGPVLLGIIASVIITAIVYAWKKKRKTKRSL